MRPYHRVWMSKWTQQQDDLLRNRYPLEGLSKDLLQTLGRTKGGAQTRVSDLGLRHSLHWTKEESDILVSNYHRGMDVLAEMLSKRNRSAIRSRILKLRLFDKKWTPEDVGILLEEYPKNGPSLELQKQLNRSRTALIGKFHVSRQDGYKRDARKTKFKGYGEISLTYFNRIVGTAKDRDLNFDIGIEYLWKLFLEQNRKCAISGLDLVFSTNSRLQSQQTASLDRIDSNRGYIQDNLQWVHKDINIMKGRMPEHDFIRYCTLIADKHRSI